MSTTNSHSNLFPIVEPNYSDSLLSKAREIKLLICDVDGVLSNGKVYYTSEEGDIFVIKAGKIFGLMSTNKMGEVCMATPAIVGDMMIIRTQHHVVAVGE